MSKDENNGITEKVFELIEEKNEEMKRRFHHSFPNCAGKDCYEMCRDAKKLVYFQKLEAFESVEHLTNSFSLAVINAGYDKQETCPHCNPKKYPDFENFSLTAEDKNTANPLEDNVIIYSSEAELDAFLEKTKAHVREIIINRSQYQPDDFHAIADRYFPVIFQFAELYESKEFFEFMSIILKINGHEFSEKKIKALIYKTAENGGLNYKEIAAKLKTSENNVAQIFKRLKENFPPELWE